MTYGVILNEVKNLFPGEILRPAKAGLRMTQTDESKN